MLIAGTTVFGLSSLVGGLAGTDGMLIGARLAQGLGAALMTPAALSILTTSFREGSDRVKAIGAWSATIPLASAIGVLAGGLLSQGPGWRWVFFVNLPVGAVVLAGASRLAVLSAIATSRTHDLLAAHASSSAALTSGFGRALVACSLFLVASAAIATRTASGRGRAVPARIVEPVPATEAD